MLTEDLCIIEGRDYFVRGVIVVPVPEYVHGFGWRLGDSQEANFEIYEANLDTRRIGPFFG